MKTKLKKKDLLVSFIKNLKPDQPIRSKGKSPIHKGSSFTEDGIRITGTPEFVDAVISHCKDAIFALETDTTELKLTYNRTRRDGAVTDRVNFYAEPIAKVRNRDKELLDLMREQARLTAEINPKAAKAFQAAIDTFLNN